MDNLAGQSQTQIEDLAYFKDIKAFLKTRLKEHQDSVVKIQEVLILLEENPEFERFISLSRGIF